MKKINSFFKYTLFILLLLCLQTTVSLADEAGIGFQVQPIFSSKQIDTQRGFFYLETLPGEHQELEISVMSARNEDMELEVIVENAISQSVGNIGYTEDVKLIHESLKNPMTEILKPQKKSFTLKANAEEIVYLDLNVPKESYNGIKMGKVNIREKVDEGKSGIGQRFQYGIGVIISESGDMFNDGNTLKMTDAKAAIKTGSRSMIASIVNPEPKTIENLQVDSFVTKKGDSKKIKQRAVDNFAFAPNSIVDYSVPWGLTNFETGEYTFHFIAKNDFETFNLTKDFIVRADDARKLNNEAAFVVRTPKEIKLLIIVLNTVLLILCGSILVINKKRISELKSKKRKKNSKRKKRHKK